MARVSLYGAHREDILRCIHQSMLAHSKAPSVRELAEKCEVGVATMHAYLKMMAEEGVLEWRQGRHRSLRLTPLGIRELS
jgi:DNA-binding transcriptional regulator YhcF (GntR family)